MGGRRRTTARRSTRSANSRWGWEMFEFTEQHLFVMEDEDSPYRHFWFEDDKILVKAVIDRRAKQILTEDTRLSWKETQECMPVWALTPEEAAELEAFKSPWPEKPIEVLGYAEAVEREWIKPIDRLCRALRIFAESHPGWLLEEDHYGSWLWEPGRRAGVLYDLEEREWTLLDHESYKCGDFVDMYDNSDRYLAEMLRAIRMQIIEYQKDFGIIEPASGELEE